MAFSNKTFMDRYTIIIGLNDKDTKKPIFEGITEISEFGTFVRKRVNGALKGYDGGYSVSMHRGGYRHINGEFVEELSLSLVFYDITEETIGRIAETLSKVFNQESILIEKDKVLVYSYNA